MIEDSLGEKFDEVSNHLRPLLLKMENKPEGEVTFSDDKLSDPDVEALPNYEIEEGQELADSEENDPLKSRISDREGNVDEDVIDGVNRLTETAHTAPNDDSENDDDRIKDQMIYQGQNRK